MQAVVQHCPSEDDGDVDNGDVEMVMLNKVMLTMVWNMMMRESLVRGGCNCNARAASLGDPQVSPDVPTLEYQCHPC